MYSQCYFSNFNAPFQHSQVQLLLDLGCNDGTVSFCFPVGKNFIQFRDIFPIFSLWYEQFREKVQEYLDFRLNFNKGDMALCYGPDMVSILRFPFPSYSSCISKLKIRPYLTVFLVRTLSRTVFPKDLSPCSGEVTEVVSRCTSLIRYFTSQPISMMPLSAVMSCKE